MDRCDQARRGACISRSYGGRGRSMGGRALQGGGKPQQGESGEEAVRRRAAREILRVLGREPMARLDTAPWSASRFHLIGKRTSAEDHPRMSSKRTARG